MLSPKFSEYVIINNTIIRIPQIVRRVVSLLYIGKILKIYRILIISNKSHNRDIKVYFIGNCPSKKFVLKLSI